jgi:hypothetical protein
MKIIKPKCINHWGDEPFCSANGQQGECTDPYYDACPFFHPEPYPCNICGQLYDHDKIPECCVSCEHKITEEEKIKEGIE